MVVLREILVALTVPVCMATDHRQGFHRLHTCARLRLPQPRWTLGNVNSNWLTASV